jgi:hypothetical protein
MTLYKDLKQVLALLMYGSSNYFVGRIRFCDAKDCIVFEIFFCSLMDHVWQQIFFYAS